MATSTSRMFRTACACLTICPFVMCGGGGQAFTTEQRTGAQSAWVSLPPSFSLIKGRDFADTFRCGAAPRPSAADTARSAAPRAARPSTASRKRRCATALFCAPLHQRHVPTPSSPLFARVRSAAVHDARGRGEGRFRLGAVAAVRDGAGATTSAVEGAQELKGVFNTVVGEEGLLGLDGFRALADVRELLEDGLLLEAEVLTIWEAVPKADAAGDRVDFEGFCAAFARVDALFEDEEDERVEEEQQGAAGGGVGARGPGIAAGTGETEASFVDLVGSSEGVLDLDGLLRWNELTELLEEGLVSQQEVEQMWKGLPKVANRVKAAGEEGTEEGMLINLQGFLEFDRQLSDLFEDDEGGAETPPATAAAATVSPVSAAAALVVGAAAVEDCDDDTPQGQFLKLSADTGGVLTLDALLGWSEVRELMDEDLITREEVGTMFQALPKAKGRGSSSPSPAIDVKGFLEFARKLDDMFEDAEGDDEEGGNESAPPKTTVTEAPAAPAAASSSNAPLPDLKTAAEAVGPRGGNAAEAKARLLSMCQEEMADCGMGCGDKKRAKMLEAMEALLATEEGNLVLGDDLGAGLIYNLAGEWRLMYTSSNAMEYNQGLTGLANTIPNAKFQGLRQILQADGMVFDAEYKEELFTGDASEPLIITVTSDWEVKQTSSLVTGKSSVAIAVAPKQIKYGFITVRSERWKTLRAMMLLDIAYLDPDLRIMRGQTARQNFFVFRRV